MSLSRFVFAGLVVVAAAAAPASGQATTRVDVSSAGGQADRSAASLTISIDGQIVAFDSYATNLVTGDTNGVIDVFVHDRVTGVTERVSVDSAGNQSNGESTWPALSADGRYVAFMSYASNLVAGDTNGTSDVFVHDRVTGATERVSVDATGGQGDGGSRLAMLSADGSLVGFYSDATNLVVGDTNGVDDVFVHDRTTGINERISVDSSGAESDGLSYCAAGGMSADGTRIAFVSRATNLVAGDTNGKQDIFLHDRTTGVTTRVSVDSAGNQADDDSDTPALSGDGICVVFESAATDLVTGDTNHFPDAFLHDMSTGSTERCSVDSSGAEVAGFTKTPAPSTDGRYVAFGSNAATLVPFDTNKDYDVFIRDRATGTTSLASRNTEGVQGNGASGPGWFSGDAQVLVFGSKADNLVAGDTNGVGDVFVRENCRTDASWTNYGAGFPGTNGIPSLVAAGDPVLGATLSVDVGNSSGTFTFGLLVLGSQTTSLHSSLGGDLLVVPTLTSLIGLAPAGASLSQDLPLDGNLCGLIFDLQVLEADPGAAKGVSFTAGLEIVFGQ